MTWLREREFELLSWFVRRGPEVPGRWRIVRRALELARTLGPSMGERTIRCRGGFSLEVDLADWLGQYVFAVGDYEGYTSTTIARLLGPGRTMVDVGANIGYFTSLAASRVGSTGAVWAFEPSPSVRPRLERNIQLNRFSQVHLENVALSSEKGEATFYLGPPEHTGISSLRALDGSARTVAVRTARFDDEYGQRVRPDLVKIDVEGAEYKVLAGMVETLKRDRPDLVVELTPEFLESMGDRLDAVLELLNSIGYRAYAIDHEGLSPLDATRPSAPAQYNALFTFKDPRDANLRVTG